MNSTSLNLNLYGSKIGVAGAAALVVAQECQPSLTIRLNYIEPS